MTQQEQLKKALESFDEETLSATFNIEELGQIEQMLAMPNALLKQRAIDNALGIPSKEARPVEEEMSPIGQTVVGAVLPMLGDTQTGQRTPKQHRRQVK